MASSIIDSTTHASPLASRLEKGSWFVAKLGVFVMVGLKILSVALLAHAHIGYPLHRTPAPNRLRSSVVHLLSALYPLTLIVRVPDEYM